MIGGIDVRLPSRAGSDSVEVAVRAIRQLWPMATFENGNTGERYAGFWAVPFGNIEEIFVYRDTASADLWDQKGAVEETHNTMIHILYDDGLITAVVDERNAEMEAALRAIRSGLDDSIHSIFAQLEAA